MNLKKVLQKTAVVGLTGAALAFTGCISAPFVPPVGYVFNDTQAPLDLNADKTQLGAKRGEASTVCILGLFATGDASAQTAAAAGGVKTIQHADYQFFNVLGVYQKTTVVVYGD